MDVTIELRDLDDATRADMLSLRVSPQQQQFVGGSMAELLLEAEMYPEGNPWPRAVYSHGEPVGFVMLSWNCTPDPPDVIGPWYLWKLAIDERVQRRGLGRRVVEKCAELVRAEGATELLTSYAVGTGGPEDFYLGLGFVPTGDLDAEGEVIVALSLA